MVSPATSMGSALELTKNVEINDSGTSTLSRGSSQSSLGDVNPFKTDNSERQSDGQQRAETSKF